MLDRSSKMYYIWVGVHYFKNKNYDHNIRHRQDDGLRL